MALHDGALQLLYAARLRLESAVLMNESVPAAAREEVHLAVQSLDDAMRSIRQAVTGGQRVAPVLLSTELAALAAEFARNYIVPVTVESSRQELPLTGEQAGELHYIIKEAVSNAVRHGRPQRVKVSAELKGEYLQITVADDGRGFAGKEGQGLANIRRRAARLGGRLELTGARPGGTSVVLVFPYKEAQV